jgi:hypothetical protein
MSGGPPPRGKARLAVDFGAKWGGRVIVPVAWDATIQQFTHEIQARLERRHCTQSVRSLHLAGAALDVYDTVEDVLRESDLVGVVYEEEEAGEEEGSEPKEAPPTEEEKPTPPPPKAPEPPVEPEPVPVEVTSSPTGEPVALNESIVFCDTGPDGTVEMGHVAVSIGTTTMLELKFAIAERVRMCVTVS